MGFMSQSPTDVRSLTEEIRQRSQFVDELLAETSKVVVGQRNGKSWITWIGNYPEVKEANESKNPINVNFVTGALSDIQWRDRVAKAIEH